MRQLPVPLLLALTLVGATACADSPTRPAVAAGHAAFDQGSGGGSVSLGGTWSGSFTSVNGVTQLVTMSLNQSNNQVAGTAFVALASNPSVGAQDTVIGAVSGNLVALQLGNERFGTFSLGYNATVIPLDHGATEMSGELALLSTGENIALLTLTRP